MTLLLLSYSTYGQIALTKQNNTPDAEYRYHFKSVQFDYSSITYTGMDTIWNIDSLIFQNDILSKFFTRDTNYISFPGYSYNPDLSPPPDPMDSTLLRTDNAICRITDSEMYQAYKVFFPPNGAPFDDYIGETHIPYLQFPFYYNDSMDAGSGISSFEGYYKKVDTWKIADAFGSLIVNDTVYKNTLRVFTYESIYVSVSHGFSDYTSNKYEWYTEDHQLPVLSLDFIEHEWLNDGTYQHNYDTVSWIFDFKEYVPPTAINEESVFSDYFSIYPCPAKDIININTTHPITNLKLYDLLGNEIINLNNHDISSINVSSIPNGTYLIVAQDIKGLNKIKKIIILK